MANWVDDALQSSYQSYFHNLRKIILFEMMREIMRENRHPIKTTFPCSIVFLICYGHLFIVKE